MHDPSRLTISALWNVHLHPSLLNGMTPVCPKVLNRTNFAPHPRPHRRDARPDCFAVLVNGTGTAQGDAAAKLCASQSKDVTQVPQQRHVGVAIEAAIHTIYFEVHHYGPPSPDSDSIQRAALRGSPRAFGFDTIRERLCFHDGVPISTLLLKGGHRRRMSPSISLQVYAPHNGKVVASPECG